MTVPAQNGLFGFAMQAAKVDEGGTFDPGALTWYKMRSPRLALGPIQDQRTFPLEIGNAMTPTGAFKAGRFYAGEVDLLPRLEDNFGWLLKGLMGAASTTVDTDVNGNAATGVNTHTFRFVDGNDYSLPWMAFRCQTPAQVAADILGETGFDAKVANLRIVVPNSGKIFATLTCLGRDYIQELDPSWTFANAAFEDMLTVPDASRGFLKIGGVEYPIVAAEVNMANNLTTPQVENILGQFTLDDLIPITRTLTFRITYKYDNADFYLATHSGVLGGETWSELPFITQPAAGEQGVELQIQAPAIIPATSRPFGMTIRGSDVVWQLDGPPELVGGGIVLQSYMGTVLAPEDPTDLYSTFSLENAATSYA